MTPDIAIIGGGASGTLVAAQLLRRASGQPIRIALIEKSGQPGLGLAYGTRCPQHLLNVAAARMSALPDDPEHFLRWIRTREPAAEPGIFAPRSAYGEYLRGLLADAASNAPARTELERIADEVVAVRRSDTVRQIAGPSTAAPFKLVLRSGRILSADRVVLALGNLPPADPPIADGDLRRARLYARDPWSPVALEGLEGDESILLIGTGLTAVDWIAELHSRGHRGPIFAVSRHGLLPLAHEYGTTTHPLNGELAAAHTVRQLMRVLRDGAAQATRQERGWHGVMDAVRPHVQEVWRRWSAAERARFLRHARAYWDVHRHRIAPQVNDLIQSLRATGQLTTRAARLIRYREQPDATAVATLRPRGASTEETVRAARVINCTGPAMRLPDVDSPLLRTLVDGGLARYDAMEIGLDVNADGALFDATGRASAALFAIGPLRRGSLWETTAIPEIRVQAAELAQLLLKPASARQIL